MYYYIKRVDIITYILKNILIEIQRPVVWYMGNYLGMNCECRKITA